MYESGDDPPPDQARKITAKFSTSGRKQCGGWLQTGFGSPVIGAMRVPLFAQRACGTFRIEPLVNVWLRE